MKFSVIVPCYNEENNIARCISSLIKQDYKDHEIIVVDDGSTDKSRDIIKRFKKIKVINKENEGRPKAINDALKIAKGEFVAITDADCVAPRNWLSNIKKEFEKDNKLEALGGVYEPLGNGYISLAGNMFERIFMDFGLIPNTLPGANSTYKRKTLLGLKGYPIRKWGADSILDMKMREKKKKINISAKVVIKTEYPKTILSALKRKFYWGGGLAKIMDKTKFRLGFLARPIYFLLLLLSLIISFVCYLINCSTFFINFVIFAGLIAAPIIMFLFMSVIWIMKEKKYNYVKTLPVMIFLPLLQEFSYFLGFMYVLIGGKLKNAWR